MYSVDSAEIMECELHTISMQTNDVPGPDKDALTMYLGAGDMFDPDNTYIHGSYVQAPCSYLRKVIRDSGLVKVCLLVWGYLPCLLLQCIHQPSYIG